MSMMRRLRRYVEMKMYTKYNIVTLLTLPPPYTLAILRQIRRQEKQGEKLLGAKRLVTHSIFALVILLR